MMGRRAMLAGATGLVGGFLLRRLLADEAFSSVAVLSRRPTGIVHEKLNELRLENFDQLEQRLEGWEADCVFCCLGTTIKNAGSKEAFAKVDHAYPLRLAKWAKGAGVERFVLVSALGADPYSNVFYNRVKGHVERDIAALGFASFAIARPSLILGERRETRRGEEILKRLMPLMNRLLIGRWEKYRAIHADQIARALLELSKLDPDGTEVYESDELAALSEEARLVGN